MISNHSLSFYLIFASGLSFGSVDLQRHIHTHNSKEALQLTSDLFPGRVLCGGDVGFDGTPFIGYLDTDEEGENLVCKYPYIKQELKSKIQTDKYSFWIMDISGFVFLEWLYDNADYIQDRHSKNEFYKFPYAKIIKKGKPHSLTYLCTVLDSEKQTLAFGYPFTIDGVGEKCILSTRLKLSTISPQNCRELTSTERRNKGEDFVKVTSFVATKKKGWCSKELTKMICKSQKDLSNISKEQCEQSARDLGIGYCHNIRGSCCFLGEKRKINTKDTSDGENTCYLPEGVSEEMMYTDCGISNAVKHFGKELNDFFINVHTGIKKYLED